MTTRAVPRVYPALLRAAWGSAVAYRGQVVLWLLTSLFPLIMMAVWLSVVEEAGTAGGFDGPDFVSYYVAAAVTNHFTVAWVSWQWDEDIRTGGLSVKLLKPLDPFHHHAIEQLGKKLLIGAVLLPAVAAAAAVVSSIRYPVGPGTAAVAAVAVVAGFGLNLVMASAFSMLSFWSTQVNNLYQLWWGVGFFLSGWVAPLELFPPTLRRVAVLLPFRSSLGFPVEIVTGRLDGRAIAAGFAVTGAWSAGFLFVYRVLWRRGPRRYEAVGA